MTSLELSLGWAKKMGASAPFLQNTHLQTLPEVI